MLRLTNMIEKAVRSHMRESCESTLPRFDALAALDRAKGKLTMSELSERMLVSNAYVTAVVFRLVEDGLVAREVDEDDRRVQRVFMTEAGQQTFRQMAREHERLIGHILSLATEADLEQLTQRLEGLTRSVREQLATREVPERSAAARAAALPLRKPAFRRVAGGRVSGRTTRPG